MEISGYPASHLAGVAINRTSQTLMLRTTMPEPVFSFRLQFPASPIVCEEPGPYRAQARFEAGSTHVALNPDGLPVGFRFRAGDDPDSPGSSRVDVITPLGVFEVSRERGLRLIKACDPMN
jgi:hypothetical protein